jgi:hypothetical protein
MAGPAAPRRDSGLEARGRWFRPQQNRRTNRHGAMTGPRKGRGPSPPDYYSLT